MTTQSVRVEFVKLGSGDRGGNPLNMISGLLAPAIQALAVTVSATASGSRVVVPGAAGARVAVRLTAVGDIVHAYGDESGVGADATLTNGLRLVPALPVIMMFKGGTKLSFISET